ncbi:MAG: mandelate racemase/muconate lactonizing enzyme family protein [Granulosicoccus sp.]
MKIATVETFVVKAPIKQVFAFSQGWVHQRAATLVRITTDTGLQGWGEAFTQGLEPPEIAAAAIRHALAPALIGQEALDTAVIWNQMYLMTRDYGRKGSVMSAISAIDIALWDIAGKYYQKPVYQLLGGAYRASVKPYATGFYRLAGTGEAERLAEEALKYKAAGFTAMKIKLGFGIKDDLCVMRAIRAALGDSEVTLIVDTNHAYQLHEAHRLGEALAQYNLRWFEEPVVPEDINGYADLRKRLTVPIAGGENEHSAFGFNALFAARALDVAQPDIGSCGGFTAARDILAMAQANGVAVNPHVWGTAIAQAAALQYIATIPPASHCINGSEPLFEYDLSDHPFRRHLTDRPIAVQADGRVAIPEEPGLGICINMDTVKKYSVNSAD